MGQYCDPSRSERAIRWRTTYNHISQQVIQELAIQGYFRKNLLVSRQIYENGQNMFRDFLQPLISTKLMLKDIWLRSASYEDLQDGL